MRDRHWSLWLIVLGYVVFAFTGLAPQLNLPVQSHGHHVDQPLQYVGPWPSGLALAFAVAELFVIAGPLRRRERWAYAASIVPLIVAMLPRLLTDRRCFGFPWNPPHGCHSVVIASELVTIGWVIYSWRTFPRVIDRRTEGPPSPPSPPA